MIIHFIRDEKVINNIIDNFEEVGGANVFLLFWEANTEPKYISKEKLAKENVVPFSITLDDINKYIDKYAPKAILLHSLHLYFSNAINQIRQPIKKGWVAWGFDIYTLPKVTMDIYAPATYRYLRQQNRFFDIEKIFKRNPRLSKLYYAIIKRKKYPFDAITESIRKIDYFITYLEEDFHLFSKYYPNRMKFLYCSFTDIDQYLSSDSSLTIDEDAENILIGNSNTPESNHLDVFEVLSSYRTELKTVFVPLSYGNNIIYKQTVKEYGTSSLGAVFQPLDQFLDRQGYTEILKSCSCGVFFHYRQQALGNIISMLYLGARVYMSVKSPAYKYLIRNNIRVFDLEKDFHLFQNSRLDSASVTQNRNILNRLFGKNRVISDLAHLRKTICQ